LGVVWRGFPPSI